MRSGSIIAFILIGNVVIALFLPQIRQGVRIGELGHGVAGVAAGPHHTGQP